MKTKLTKQEKELERSLGRDGWKPVSKKQSKALVLAARHNVESRKKGARINIRLSPQVLDLIRSSAVKEGVPYQTFIASTLHKMVTGQLIHRQQWQELLDRVMRKQR